MCHARIELLPPGVLDISLSKLTYDELARTNCVCKTLCEGVQLVVSSLARRLGLGDHVDHLGTTWLRQMDLGARGARLTMCTSSGLGVDENGACYSFGKHRQILGRLVVQDAGRRELETPQRVGGALLQIRVGRVAVGNLCVRSGRRRWSVELGQEPPDSWA